MGPEEWARPLRQAVDEVFDPWQLRLHEGAAYPMRHRILHAMGREDGPDGGLLGPLAEDSTVARYKSHGRRMLAMLLRRSEPAFAAMDPLPPPLLPAVHEITRALSTPAGLARLPELLVVTMRIAFAHPVVIAARGPEAQGLPFAYTAHLAASRPAFMAANDLSGVIAAITYWARCIVLDMVEETWNAFDLHLIDPVATATREAAVDNLMLPFKESAFTAYGALRRAYHLVKAAARDTVAHREVTWVGDGFTALVVDGVQVSQASLSTTYQLALREARAGLGTCLLGMEPTKTLQDAGFDSLSSRTPGHWFGLDARNGLLQEHKQLPLHIRADHALAARFLDHAAQRYKAQAVVMWLDQGRQLLKTLLLLVHLSSGLPARASELATIKITNVPGGQRSIFLSSGTIAVIISYNKSSTSNGIARFLPVPVAEVLFHYLVYIRPLQVHMADSIGKATLARSLRTFLFVGTEREMDGPAIIHTWRAANTRFNGTSLSIAAYRHAVESFFSQNILRKPENSTQLAPAVLPATLQAGHSVRVGASLYAQASEDRHPELNADNRWVMDCVVSLR